MRIILDTNVFISGVLSGGIPAQILVAWQEKRVRLVATVATLSEIHRVAKRIQDKGYSVNFKPYLELLAVDCDICEPSERISKEDVVRDADDNMFIHCALESGVKIIVSGDKDLLALRNYQDIQIYNPREFYEMFLT